MSRRFVSSVRADVYARVTAEIICAVGFCSPISASPIGLGLSTQPTSSRGSKPSRTIHAPSSRRPGKRSRPLIGCTRSSPSRQRRSHDGRRATPRGRGGQRDLVTDRGGGERLSWPAGAARRYRQAGRAGAHAETDLLGRSRRRRKGGNRRWRRQRRASDRRRRGGESRARRSSGITCCHTVPQGLPERRALLSEGLR
jgi:hypothetical protein